MRITPALVLLGISLIGGVSHASVANVKKITVSWEGSEIASGAENRLSAYNAIESGGVMLSCTRTGARLIFRPVQGSYSRRPMRVVTWKTEDTEAATGVWQWNTSRGAAETEDPSQIAEFLRAATNAEMITLSVGTDETTLNVKDGQDEVGDFRSACRVLTDSRHG
jgi:hypothetical protein